MGKRVVEMALPLDVRAMQRDGCLRVGAVFSRHWRWQSNGESAGSIGGIAHENSVALAYKHAGETVTQDIALEWTRCNYGGRRVWWRCPACARRVALLYASGKYFACRHCYRLCYQSQLEQQPDRWLRAAWEIRRRLGQRDGGHFDRIPDKPKGMHWETYSRLHLRCDELERRDRAAMAVRFGWRE